MKCFVNSENHGGPVVYSHKHGVLCRRHAKGTYGARFEQHRIQPELSCSVDDPGNHRGERLAEVDGQPYCAAHQPSPVEQMVAVAAGAGGEPGGATARPAR